MILCKIKLLLSPYMIAILLVFPVCLLAAGEFMAAQGDSGIRVGLAYRDGEAAGAALFFEKAAGDQAEIIIYEDAELMKRDIVRRYLECGYEITAPREVTIYVTEGTFSEETLRMSMTSSIIADMAGQLGYDGIRRHFPEAAPEAVIQEIGDRANEYLKDGLMMGIEKITGEDYPDENAPVKTGVRAQPNLRITLHGVLAIFAMLLAMANAMSLSEERLSGAGGRLKACGISALYARFASCAALFAVQALFLVIGHIYVGRVADLAPTIAAIAFYSAALSIAGVLMAEFVTPAAFPGLICVIFVSAGLFGGLFFQIKEIAPQMEWAQYLYPGYYYMRMLFKI